MCRLCAEQGIDFLPNYKVSNNLYKERRLCDLECNKNFGERPPFSHSACFLVGV